MTHIGSAEEGMSETLEQLIYFCVALAGTHREYFQMNWKGFQIEYKPLFNFAKSVDNLNDDCLRSE